jgi:hypothetical protein
LSVLSSSSSSLSSSLSSVIIVIIVSHSCPHHHHCQSSVISCPCPHRSSLLSVLSSSSLSLPSS